MTPPLHNSTPSNPSDPTPLVLPVAPILTEDRTQSRGRSREPSREPRTRVRRITEMEFDETQLYAYPTHLREAIDHLPQAPGIYIFHGEEGDLPLYIGKSINIRSRVLSHLRTADEARLLRQTRRISFQRTAGEIGALLLESRLIKTLHPLHNQKLRLSRQLCAWRMEEGRPVLVDAKNVNFAQEPGLYGLYASRHAALQHLRKLADTHRLCYGVLGLEKLTPGRACFRAQLHQCAGACCGRETLTDHQERFLTALLDVQVITWPYASHGADTVALVERDESRATNPQATDPQTTNPQTNEPLEDFHVVRNWCYLGTVHSFDEAKTLDTVAARFDADSYKILCRPLMTQTVTVVAL